MEHTFLFCSVLTDETDSSIDLLFHLFMELLVDSPMCLDWDPTHNLGVWGQHSKQLSNPARAGMCVLRTLPNESCYLAVTLSCLRVLQVFLC